MLIIFLTFLVSIICSQNIENIYYDFSKHQGHIIKEGSLFWNEDWHSNELFFDGTFANYPSTYGPIIEKNFYKPMEDTSSVDSSNISSYFDYAQGDYYLDNLDLGIKYLRPNREINLYAFKRRYAGAYNQYNYSNGLISPIQYTYLGNYNYKKGYESLFLSLGNLNSNFGLLDSTNNSFLDSRITSLSLKYENQYDIILFENGYNIFFQRLDGFHSSSVLSGVTYLTRSKIDGSIIMLSPNNYNIGLSYNLNERSLDIDAVKNFNWNVFDFFIQNEKNKYSVGFNTFKGGSNLVFNFISNIQLGSIRSKIHYERSYKPYHIAYTDSLTFEQKDFIWIENSLSAKKLQLSFDFAFQKLERKVKNVGLPAKGNNLWVSFYLGHIFKNKLEFIFRYNKSISNDYVNDGIGDRIKIKLGNNFNLFSNAMSVHYFITIDGYMKRTNEYALTPIERYPSKQIDSIPLQDSWVPSFAIKSFIKNVEITYEMKHLKNIINNYIGNKIDDQIIFNKFYPSDVRLASLSITWNFLN